ncbi:MAG: hypothetical protein O2820_10560 [Planctomycetota bacterium]|nr:hypothetical protein [Planctomycetota bacterium]MDA1249651.1 hypothetical protein [Planctomycetota bacterium]
MSDKNTPSPPETTEAAAPHKEVPVKHIYLVAYPKLIFLYPTFIAAVVAGCFMAFAGMGDAEVANPSRGAEVMSLIFLGILTINLVVLTFDFPRTTSLTLFFFVAMILMGLFVFFKFNPDFLPVVGKVLGALQPYANAHFYFLFAGVLLAFFLAILVAVQFDYWEVRPNELLHHHGMMSDLKRYPAPNLRIDKEINDVFEYMLLRSGRLILHARHETRAIVLDNVLFINAKEKKLTTMLGALQVSVRDDE